MTVNFKEVFRVIGILLMILALSILLPIITALYYGETKELQAFIITMAACFSAGLILTKIINPSLKKIKARDGYLIVALCWIIAPLVAAFPLWFTGAIKTYIDCFFEMCSGFSTTGSTILTEIESLPKSILFWRSFTHWLGGMGIIVLAMAFLTNTGVKGQLIASAETPGPTLSKVTPRFHDTAKNLYMVYLAFTLLETIFLMFGGLSLYDSLIQTFGTVGTGGFSNYNDSIAHFSSTYVNWVIIVFMTLCGINFNLYFVGTRTNIREVLKDSELKTYFRIIGGSILLILLNLLYFKPFNSFFENFTHVVFQVVSIITTTGFITQDYDLWPTFAKSIILMLFFVGACSSSTGGGVKVVRVLVGWNFIKRAISLKLHPKVVYPIRVNKRVVPQETATNIANFIFLYYFVVLVGSVLISFNGFDLLTSFSAVATCVGNIGPGFNGVGPSMNFNHFSDFSKLILSFLMIAGRLELFTLLMLFSPYYWNSNKS